jgi:hypothetical protein
LIEIIIIHLNIILCFWNHLDSCFLFWTHFRGAVKSPSRIIIYLESLYNTLYFDIKFISEYWKMNSKSWQDGLFHGTKLRENYQCSRLWCQIILLMIISVKRWLKENIIIITLKATVIYKIYMQFIKNI